MNSITNYLGKQAISHRGNQVAINQRTHSIMKSKEALTPEEIAKILDAILSGKYSWACVLFLEFHGYAPLDYIPYNTYNRIVKQNIKNNSPD